MATTTVYPRLCSSTWTSRALRGNHIVSIPFETIVKKKHIDVDDLIPK